eukprot:gene17365-19102_t
MLRVATASFGIRSAFARVAGIHSSAALNMTIKAGDALPSVEVYESTPADKVNVADLFKDKKGILFAVPGAFTPGCSNTHLPGYVNDFEKIKAKGVTIIACISVNDPFVMSAWGDQHETFGKIHMLADMKADFTKAVGMELDATGLLGNIRSKRYAMIVENSIVKNIHVEPDETGLSCSLSENMISHL